MKKDHENIEEKLVPYLEGVLNPKERREVDEAINSDGELAREMSELRDVILQLRQGFASGLRPPQEEVTVDEVVELGSTTGSVDKLPGTSQQKARLFCSDQALEEYSMLRALSEEMGRTTLDRENVPAMPEALLKEFKTLKGSAPSAGKVLAFDKKKLSPVPLWKRASGMLDRIDPKPLMASAAALVMLSLGVHMYNRTPAPMAASENKEIGYSFSDQPTAAPSATASSTPVGVPRLAGQESGVAVFTSDDRGLLKQQAEKLMSGKVRYTVTKDRILVAEKDVKIARDILWADEDGKAVAMAKKEKAADSALEQPKASAGIGAARPAEGLPDGAYSGGGADVDQSSSQPQAPVVDDAAIEAVARGGEADVTLYRSEPARAPAPTRSSAPARPAAPARPKAPAAAPRREEGPRAAASAPRRQAQSALASESAAPAPTDVRFDRPAAPISAPAGVAAGAAPSSLNSESKPRTTSAERRAQLQKLALEGADRDDVAGDDPPTPTQVQTTTTVERARVAANPPSASASAPVPNVVTADSVEEETSEEGKADGRLAKMETSRQKVAQRHGVELSFEAKSGKVAVYVRPKKTLTKAELDTLRKTLRKELGLADSDTIIFR